MKETKHELRSVCGLRADLHGFPGRHDILACEQGAGVPRMGNLLGCRVDRALHQNHGLLLWTFGAGNLPPGALLVPELALDSETHPTASRDPQEYNVVSTEEKEVDQK